MMGPRPRVQPRWIGGVGARVGGFLPGQTLAPETDGWDLATQAPCGLNAGATSWPRRLDSGGGLGAHGYGDWGRAGQQESVSLAQYDAADLIVVAPPCFGNQRFGNDVI